MFFVLTLVFTVNNDKLYCCVYTQDGQTVLHRTFDNQADAQLHADAFDCSVVYAAPVDVFFGRLPS